MVKLCNIKIITSPLVDSAIESVTENLNHLETTSTASSTEVMDVEELAKQEDDLLQSTDEEDQKVATDPPMSTLDLRCAQLVKAGYFGNSCEDNPTVTVSNDEEESGIDTMRKELAALQQINLENIQLAEKLREENDLLRRANLNETNIDGNFGDPPMEINRLETKPSKFYICPTDYPLKVITEDNKKKIQMSTADALKRIEVDDNRVLNFISKHGLIIVECADNKAAMVIQSNVMITDWEKHEVPPLKCADLTEIAPSPVIEMWAPDKGIKFEEAKVKVAADLKIVCDSWQLIKTNNFKDKKGVNFICTADQRALETITSGGNDSIKFSCGIFIGPGWLRIPKGYKADGISIENIYSETPKNSLIKILFKINVAENTARKISVRKSCVNNLDAYKKHLMLRIRKFSKHEGSKSILWIYSENCKEFKKNLEFTNHLNQLSKQTSNDIK